MSAAFASQGRLVATPDQALEQDAPSTVYESRKRTIVVPDDPDARQRMLIIEASGVLDFWSDEGEDIYSTDRPHDLQAG